MVATASRDQLVKVFDIRAMKEFVTLRGHKKEVCCASAALSLSRPALELDELRGSRVCRATKLTFAPSLAAVAWHPHHDDVLVSGGSEGSILHWSLPDAHPKETLEFAHDSNVWSLAYHPLGHLLVSASNDHTTRFWSRGRPGTRSKGDRFHLGRERAMEVEMQMGGPPPGSRNDGASLSLSPSRTLSSLSLCASSSTSTFPPLRPHDVPASPSHRPANSPSHLLNFASVSTLPRHMHSLSFKTHSLTHIVSILLPTPLARLSPCSLADDDRPSLPGFQHQQRNGGGSNGPSGFAGSVPGFTSRPPPPPPGTGMGGPGGGGGGQGGPMPGMGSGRPPLPPPPGMGGMGMGAPPGMGMGMGGGGGPGGAGGGAIPGFGRGPPMPPMGQGQGQGPPPGMGQRAPLPPGFGPPNDFGRGGPGGGGPPRGYGNGGGGGGGYGGGGGRY